MCGHAMLCAALLVPGCGAEPTPEPVPTVVPELPAPTALDLTCSTDGRARDGALERALRSADPELRAAAMRGLARMQDPSDESISLLSAGLRDPEPAVRDQASLGLGALGPEAPERVGQALAGAIASEEDVELRSSMIRDLGRLRTDDALAAIVPELRSAEPAYRAAACFGVAERGLAGVDVSREIRARLASRLDPAEPEEVRFGCTYALSRTTASDEPDGLRSEVVALGAAVADPSPAVRFYAYRALGRTAASDLDVIAHGTRDDDWQVRAQAFRALGQRALQDDRGPRVLAREVRTAFNALREDRVVLPGPPLHVFLTALSSSNPVARTTPIHDLAAEMLGALGTPRSRDHALAQCAAADLVDRSRGWPSRVLDCGGDEVEEWERQVLEAEILGDLEGAESQRLVRLRRLFAIERPAVREAVLASAAKIVTVESTDLVLAAFEVDDAGVRAAALDALKTIASRRPTADVVPPPLPAARVRAALRRAREATPDGELETLVTWIGAARAADERELGAQLTALATHPNVAVRTEARAVLRAWELEVPTGRDPIENPITIETLTGLAPRPRVRLHTDRGPVLMELRADIAPTTVARFLELARDGYFDGLTFHRVVPGFVVQGGDPRGDGYGGPGWSQRCEDSRLRYVRGSVGMALAGRDTGGSQFFITHGPQPHLDGRYTVFAQVVEGLDNVDQIQRGDRIVRAEVLSE